MITKAYEMELLKKIETLINEAGPDSYIGMTFAGIIEQAEDNIKNDFANNYKELYEHQTKNCIEARDEVKEMIRHNDGLKERLRETKKALELELTKNNEYVKAYEDMCEKAAGYARDVRIRQDKVDSLESEITTLKAKLYDLMTA